MTNVGVARLFVVKDQLETTKTHHRVVRVVDRVSQLDMKDYGPFACISFAGLATIHSSFGVEKFEAEKPDGHCYGHTDL